MSNKPIPAWHNEETVYESTTLITLKGCRVNHVDESTEQVTLSVPTKPLTPAQADCLQELFPDLENQVSRLLTKQILLTLTR